MSMATILAPRFLRARVTWVIRLTCVATALVPQMTTQSAFSISSALTPRILPVPAMKPGDADADVAVIAGIALGVGQALDAVAHDKPHRAGVEMRPDALSAVPTLGV